MVCNNRYGASINKRSSPNYQQPLRPYLPTAVIHELLSLSTTSFHEKREAGTHTVAATKACKMIAESALHIQFASIVSPVIVVNL